MRSTTSKSVGRPLLVAVAAAVYLVAAWMVAPGFYDGFAPIQPYNWVCPPPAAGANSSLKAASGHLVINVIDGSSDPNSAFTDDGQIVIGFLPGAFDATGKTTITVDITPVSPCPKPAGVHFATNVYLITADAKLTMKANLVMLYSNLVPAPSFVYQAQDPNGPWQSIGGNEGQIYTLQATVSQLGYFAAGYPSNAVNQNSSGTSQLLPIAVAVLIVGVVIAGIPLAMLRRRSAGQVDEEDDEDEPEITRRT
ncbi:MAG TPA: hypothetical protein VNU19_02925 [Candidatus Acidoferrum sp.]|jgi:hypothetical protein|nr:hypothetical protein [Candidatus Acidoferrum sp.]